MEKVVHASNEVKNTKLTTEEYEREFAALQADLKREREKPKVIFDNSRTFEFEINKPKTIEFVGLPRIDENFVYGKVRRKSDGSLDKGPKGELYHVDTGDILYSKFKDKNGNARLLQPAKRWLYFGHHLGNKDEMTSPKKFVATLDQHMHIFPLLRKTQIFEITKGSDNKYLILPLFDQMPDLDPSDIATDEEIAAESV